MRKRIYYFFNLLFKSISVLIYFIIFLNFLTIITAYIYPEIKLNDEFYNLPLDERWGGGYFWESIAYLIAFGAISVHLYWFTQIKTKWKLILFGLPIVLIPLINGILFIVLEFYNSGDLVRGVILIICSIVILYLLTASPKIDLARYTGLENISKWHLLWLWIPIGTFLPPFFIVLIFSVKEILEDIIQLLTLDYSVMEFFKDIILGIIIALSYNTIKYSFVFGLFYIQRSNTKIKIKLRNLLLSWAIFTLGFGAIYLIFWTIITWFSGLVN